jgi:hypothetical protein
MIIQEKPHGLLTTYVGLGEQQTVAHTARAAVCCSQLENAFLMGNTNLPFLTMGLMDFAAAMELVGTILLSMELPPTLAEHLENLRLKRLGNVHAIPHASLRHASLLHASLLHASQFKGQQQESLQLEPQQTNLLHATSPNLKTTRNFV